VGWAVGVLALFGFQACGSSLCIQPVYLSRLTLSIKFNITYQKKKKNTISDKYEKQYAFNDIAK